MSIIELIIYGCMVIGLVISAPDFFESLRNQGKKPAATGEGAQPASQANSGNFIIVVIVIAVIFYLRYKGIIKF